MIEGTNSIRLPGTTSDESHLGWCLQKGGTENWYRSFVYEDVVCRLSMKCEVSKREAERACSALKHSGTTIMFRPEARSATAMPWEL